MKFNWGKGIGIFIILFLAAMACFVYFASNQDFDLVEEDYYPKELDWDSQIDKKINNASLEDPVSVIFYDSLLYIAFPDFFKGKEPEGEILLYRPSSKSLDLLYTLDIDDSANQQIVTRDLPSGRYVVKLDWQYDGKSYYLEKSILKK